MTSPEIDPNLSDAALLESAPPIEAAGSLSRYAYARGVGAVVLMGLALMAGPPEAEAGERKSRYEPNEGDWIANVPSGYYVGRAFSDENDKLKKLGSSPSKTYDFGTVEDKRADKCGWLEEDVIKTFVPSYINKTCTASRRTLRNRYSFGKDFNCPPRVCVSGTTDGPITEECDGNFYYNFATSRRSPLNNNPNGYSGFHDYAGKETGPVSYRFMTKYGSEDGHAVVVRSQKFGWGYMRDECVADEYRRGGVMRNSASVAGASPNDGDKARREYYTPGGN